MPNPGYGSGAGRGLSRTGYSKVTTSKEGTQSKNGSTSSNDRIFKRNTEARLCEDEEEDFTRPPEASSDEEAKPTLISKPLAIERPADKASAPPKARLEERFGSSNPVYSAKTEALNHFPVSSFSSGQSMRKYGKSAKAKSQSMSSQRTESSQKSAAMKVVDEPEDEKDNQDRNERPTKRRKMSTDEKENKESPAFRKPRVNGEDLKPGDPPKPKFSLPPSLAPKEATPPKFRIPISSGILPSSPGSRESSVLSPCPSPPFTPRRSQSPASGDSSVTAPAFRTFPLKTTLCPVCKTAILKSDLEKFKADRETSRNNFQLTARQEAAFCRLHRKTDAQSEWDEAGYPMIDWSQLPQRIDCLMEDIKSIFDDESKGFWYRDRLRRDLETKSQRRRKVATTYDQDQDATHTLGEVGYYGNRGGRVVSERVVANFSSILGTLAPRDPLILGAGGVSDFVQKVIVPETLCRLICEDMGLGDDLDAAREIMQKSQELGRILCEEEDEVALHLDVPAIEFVI